MEQKRGQLTQRIKDKSKELLGYEISLAELRLLPYVQYVSVNDQKFDLNKINAEELDILSNWHEKGYLEGGQVTSLKVTKEFWSILNEILFLGYVDLHE